ncbi:MAG: hypothetical protein ABFD77_10330 [Thermotogota bacterium]
MLWAAALVIATTGALAPVASESPESVLVPPGSPVTLDGTLQPGEWNDACRVAVSDALALHIKHADGSLCVGVRAPEMGVGSLLVLDGETIRILHSSAALGTAEYEPGENGWRLKTDFVWRCRSLGMSAAVLAERQRFLETDGWLASTSYMGVPGDREYRVTCVEDSVRVAFVWLPAANPSALVTWPADLTQDAFPGPIPAVAHFDPGGWVKLTLQPSGQNAASPCSAVPVGELAFSSQRGGNTDIYAISADGTNLRRLTTAPCEDLEPSWSPDGERLAYQSRRPMWRILTMRPDGTEELTVTNSLSWSPAWSPDGLWLAYSTGASIQRISPTGAERQALVPACGDCGRPAWSPDGAWLTFHSDTGGSFDIYVMDLQTGSARRLTETTSRDFLASWSPDSSHLVFASDRDGDFEIYTVALDGTDLTRLTDNLAEDILPAWSPSGDWIAFVSDRDGNREIYVMALDGSCVRRLTDNPGEDMYPAWRP